MYVYIIYIIHYIDIKKHKKTTSSNTKAFVHILVNSSVVLLGDSLENLNLKF